MVNISSNTKTNKLLLWLILNSDGQYLVKHKNKQSTPLANIKLQNRKIKTMTNVDELDVLGRVTNVEQQQKSVSLRFICVQV